ncbi:Dicer-like protein 2-2 [Tetrabaena socialis]|uniref:Dicer-like protein 2-2 n=1 Tax=Tetrabaena socialis TaxID=47790 RepID=A0A2J8A7T4_9CHLO|nr:Dicer-like protein 2-2 [Tetrabaena socialis]|eukprot:PNH08565.1 Dicer-like protein 2-2 [Tetrabaena socialis]
MSSAWEELPQALTACGVLPSLPAPDVLRCAAASVAGFSFPAPASASGGGCGGGVLPTLELHDTMAACVYGDGQLADAEGGRWVPLATLLTTALAAEHLCRERSTRAALLRSADGAIGSSLLRSDVAAGATGSSSGRAAAGGSNAATLSVSVAGSKYRDLLFLSLPAIVGKLLKLLGEEDEQHRFFTSLAAQLTAAGVVEVLERTESSRNVWRMDNGESRTPGGVFIKEATAFIKTTHKAVVVAAPAAAPQPLQGEPALPPLRLYQRRVLQRILSDWGLPLPAELQGPEGGSSQASAGGPAARPGGSNWLVCSPTGSGKTRMCAEVARAVVVDTRRLGRGAVVVMLVPRVVLTMQQRDAFAAAGLPDTDVEAHNSEQQLSLDVWEDVLAAATPARGARSSVLAVTPDSFLNLLRVGAHGAAVHCGQVDLLVLDEAHHCKDDHSYAKVAEMFRGTAYGHGSELRGRTRVLGVTASPAGHEDLAELEVLMHELLRQLGGARMLPVKEQDADVAAVLAAPTERKVEVAMRGIDRQLTAVLRLQALDLALDVGLALKEALTRLPQAAGDVANRLVQDLQRAAARRQDTLLGEWIGDAVEFSQQWGCPVLELACHWLDVVRRAADLVEDAGYEGVLPYLARKAAAVCREELRLQQQQAPNDIVLPVSRLVQRLLADAGSGLVAAMGGTAGVVRDCFASGELQRCRGRESFHGIVFVKTRQAVYHVADMMRRCSQLHFAQAWASVGGIRENGEGALTGLGGVIKKG